MSVPAAALADEAFLIMYPKANRIRKALRLVIEYCTR
jgi:hypothetical protein